MEKRTKLIWVRPDHENDGQIIANFSFGNIFAVGRGATSADAIIALYRNAGNTAEHIKACFDFSGRFFEADMSDYAFDIKFAHVTLCARLEGYSLAKKSSWNIMATAPVDTDVIVLQFHPRFPNDEYFVDISRQSDTGKWADLDPEGLLAWMPIPEIDKNLHPHGSKKRLF